MSGASGLMRDVNRDVIIIVRSNDQECVIIRSNDQEWSGTYLYSTDAGSADLVSHASSHTSLAIIEEQNQPRALPTLNGERNENSVFTKTTFSIHKNDRTRRALV